jgi:hypothetical protein
MMLGVSGVSGSDTECRGNLIGAFDNVVVPPGEVCSLTNSVVKGNVKALENSVLIMDNDQVGGSIEGDKADNVTVFSSVVQGNIEIKDTPLIGEPGHVTGANVVGTTLPNGNIVIEKNSASEMVITDNILKKGSMKVEENFGVSEEALIVDRNVVAQNLQVFKIRGPGVKSVQFNTVGQNLQCFENDPPFFGSPNTAHKAEGQCS